MKVILKTDVSALGKSGDLKDVNDGYGRNFLLKTGLAILATDQAIKEYKQKKESEEKKIEKEKSVVEGVYQKLNGFKIKTYLKFGEGETAFGSVSISDVANLLKERGFEIKNSDILLDANIKTSGEHPVKIKLKFGFEPRVIIVVEKEK